MNNFFKNKKIMIIVPHPDDELNIAGGLLCDKNIDKKKVYILCATNGDYFRTANTRIKEITSLANYLSIPCSNLIFLGYSDQYFNGKTHFYTNMKNSPVSYSNGRTETYCSAEYDDYHYKITGKHALFNHKDFVSDLFTVIEKERPEVIITIDFDSHPDHRALSLGFEEAMGQLLSNDSKYRPIVLKTFAYPLSYFSIPDFDKVKNNNAVFKTEKHSFSKYQNPYYEIKDSYIYDCPKECKRKILLFNKLYKCLKKHRSQLLVKKSLSIINDNYIYWLRRTDNLLYEASVKSSSGDAKYLSDFKYFDCMDIMKGNKKPPILESCSCLFDKNDKRKEINITFAEKKSIKKIVFYNDINNCDKKATLTIKINSQEYELKLDGKLINDISFSKQIITDKINIKVKTKQNFGLSEIEIFDSEERIDLPKYEEEKSKEYRNFIVRFINWLTINFDWYMARIINKYNRIKGDF